MSLNSQTLQEIKEDPSKLDALLYPAKPLWDVPTESLRITVLPSGFPSLDDYLFIKQNRGELIVVAGGTSSGKSALMFQTAFNVAKQAEVLVYSLEMDHEQILTRYISGRVDRSLPAIQQGVVSDATIEKVKQEIRDTLKCSVDCKSRTIDSIVDSALNECKRKKVDLIVVDYLQIIAVGEGHSRATEVASISRALKSLAMEAKVPVMVGAQINRNAALRGQSSGNYRPMLYDLRESGSIEQDADVVLLISRPSQFKPDERPGEADLIVAKNRNGPTGEVTMQFVGTQTRFVDKQYDF